MSADPVPSLRPSAGTKSEARAQVLVATVVALGVCSMLLYLWFAPHLAIPDPATWRHGEVLTASYDPPVSEVELFHNQGDGQIYAHTAQDPFVRHPERIRGGVAEQAYRLQRPLFGWVGWLASGGDPGAVAWAMIYVTVASVGLLVAVAGVLALRFGRSALWGLAMMAAPGVYVDVLRCGPEALGTALIGMGFLVLEPAWARRPLRIDLRRVSDRRLAAAVACFALAGLTRESFLAVPVVMAAVGWWEARPATDGPDGPDGADGPDGLDDMAAAAGRFRWAWPLVSVVPLAVWILALRVMVGAWPSGSEGEGRFTLVPFQGLVQGVEAWWVGELASTLFIFGLAAAGFAGSRSLVLRWSIGVHVAMAAGFGAVVWYTWVGYSRVLLPLSLLGYVAVLDSRSDAGSGDG